MFKHMFIIKNNALQHSYKHYYNIYVKFVLSANLNIVVFEISANFFYPLASTIISI